jgi:RNA-directed DNA polymerase
VYPGLIRLNQRTRRRFRRQVRGLERAYAAGLLDDEALCSRAASLFAHVAHADSHRLRRQMAAATLVDG